jgi:sterol 3beta-glucosyltransferase
VRRAGVRALIQAGWAELDLPRTDDVLAIGEVPHDWLLPRTALAVHHAGAGTTAAALRAGTPMVTTPIYADQPLWARQVAKLGLGPPPVPFRRLTADRLAAAIRDALDTPRYAARARNLAQQIRAEDGATPVVGAVNRLAP